MDPFFSLILLCIAMLVASFLAGNVPLSFHLSEDRLKLISNFGVGLLVGTSLVVIIPEGVETLYSVPHPPAPAPGTLAGGVNHNKPIKRALLASGGDNVVAGLYKASSSRAGHLLRKRDAVVVTDPEHAYVIQDKFLTETAQEGASAPSTFEDNFALTRKPDVVHFQQTSSQIAQLNVPTLNHPVKRQDINLDGEEPAPTAGEEDKSGKDENPDTTTGDDDEEDEPNTDGAHGGEEEHQEEEENDAHKYIGLALLSGFILMFLIDQMGPTHAHSHNNHVSVADFTELHNLQLDDSNIRMPSAAGSGMAKTRGNPITIGLVVHAAADGIALGASASRPELRFIVFLAIMLHKAPAAFGLSTVLLQHGFSRRQTRQQVAIFSLAAPVGALLTYIFIQLSGQREAASLHWWTGMLLLFSGGTFLYVAMHVMSEMNNSERSNSSSGYSVGGNNGSEKGLSVVEVLCVIGGMIVPLILAVDHEH